MSLYETLRTDLLMGRYAPGSKLRMETLKETYGGSVNVLRENLVRLSAEGLVEAEDQKGFRVASLTPDRLRDLTRLRILLETDGARHSFGNGGVEWESNLVAAHHKLAYMEGKMHEDETAHFLMWHQCDYEFHAALIAACGSGLHQRYHKQVYDQFRQYVVVELKTYGFRGSEIVDEHEAVMRAALKRDLPALEQALSRHLGVFASGIPLA